MGKDLTAAELLQKIEAGDISSLDVMRQTLDRMEKRNDSIRAYISILPREALESAAISVDERRSRGEKVGVLAGLPIAIKDNICTRGVRTTCASQMLRDYVPPYSATVVQRIEAQDGIVIGKTNMDEFAMGSSTENSSFFPTRNPHDIDYVPGGTSGGSAAAVADYQAALALGSDTGGSVRQPASFCGVVGMKPTYGRVSRFGLIAYASSLDQIGPMGRSVRDVALLLQVIAGFDPSDSTSSQAPVPEYLRELDAPPARLRVGVPREYFAEGLDPEVRASVEGALARLEGAGAQLVEVSLPHAGYAIESYYLVACSEASSNLARYDGVRYGSRSQDHGDLIEMFDKTRTAFFGDEVKRRIILGTYALSAGYYDAFYLKAMQVRTLIRQDFVAAFEACDIIAHPVAPTPAYRIGEKKDDPLAMWLGDIYSVTANLTGLPAISIPCGQSLKKLPIGIQLVAPHLEEVRLLQVAYHLESLLAKAEDRSAARLAP